MKGCFKKITLGLVALSFVLVGKASYAASAAEYALILAITNIGLATTQSRINSGLKINSAKDDVSGMSYYTLSITNPPIPEGATDVDIVIRYKDAKGQDYVVKTGFIEHCKPPNLNAALGELICTIGNPSSSTSDTTKSDSTISSGDSSTTTR